MNFALKHIEYIHNYNKKGADVKAELLSLYSESFLCSSFEV